MIIPVDLSLQSLSLWLTLINSLWASAITVMMYLRKPGLDAQDAVYRVKTTITRHRTATDRRLDAIESDMRHAATEGQIKEIDGALKQLDERIDGLSKQLEPIVSHLLRKGIDR